MQLDSLGDPFYAQIWEIKMAPMPVRELISFSVWFWVHAWRINKIYFAKFNADFADFAITNANSACIRLRGFALKGQLTI